MVHEYRRVTVTKYTEETLQKCITCVKKGKMSMKKASRHFGVPYGTARNKANWWYLKSSGGQTALSQNLEEVILQSLDQLKDWKVPFDSISVCSLVKDYLDKKR